MHNRKGAAAVPVIIGVSAILVVVLLGAIAWVVVGGGNATAAFSDENTDRGDPLTQLSAVQMNMYSGVTEGSNDIEFWAPGVLNDADPSNTPLETLTFSSGAVADTSVTLVSSGDTHKTRDLWVEGGSAYYDEFVPIWSIRASSETLEGLLEVPSTSGAVMAVDIGTFADFDNPDAVDTGFTEDNSAGAINYSESAGDGSVYFRIPIGNEEVDSELRDVVLCLDDSDKDLEGDEITAITVSLHSGQNVQSFNTNLLTLFTDAAGSGDSCQNVGDIINDGAITKGTYQVDLVIDETKTEPGEDITVVIDDNGDLGAKDYPSRDAKASSEDLAIQFVA